MKRLANAADIDLGNLRLLLVDDDEVDRMTVVRTLRTSGIGSAVVEASGPDEALGMVDHQRFDCLLLDYNMPRMNGLELLRRVRAQGWNTPAVVLTGQGDENLAVELMRSGASDYINKSALTPERLVKGILTAVRIGNARQAAHDAQEALTRQVELAEMLIGVVSHDLRNPLNAMMLTAQAMMRRDTGDEVKKLAGRIHSSGVRANGLINDLLDFTQVRGGQGIPVRPLPTHLHEVVIQIAQEAAEAHASRRIEVATQGPSEWVVDAARMGQVVSNLIVNALAHGDRGSPVTVQAIGGIDSYVIEVHNKGPAIPVARHEELFLPLRRGGQPAAQGNIGLGLFIVKHIVTAHGGDVQVESSDEAGTTFRVTLRRPEHAPEEPH